jgi:hypothetical protein
VGEGRFGYGVAVSGDGLTAMVGGITDNGAIGAAWPFVRPLPPDETKEQEEQEQKEREEREQKEKEQKEREAREQKEKEEEEAAKKEPPEGPLGKEPTGTTGTTTGSAASTGSTGSTTGGGGVLPSITVSAPVLAVTGNVAPVAGKVLVKLPHHKSFELLPGLRQIPFGSIVDATDGRVVITVASKNGGTQTGEFFGGQFVLTQGKGGVVVVALTGGQNVACSAKHATRARAAKTRRRRRLWASAHGTFTTKGNYAVGAVQGTEWLTEDNCEGTYIRVTRDKVKVTDLVHHKSKIIKAGHSILVKHP